MLPSKGNVSGQRVTARDIPPAGIALRNPLQREGVGDGLVVLEFFHEDRVGTLLQGPACCVGLIWRAYLHPIRIQECPNRAARAGRPRHGDVDLIPFSGLEHPEVRLRRKSDVAGSGGSAQDIREWNQKRG